MPQIKHFFQKKILTIFLLGISSGLPLGLVLSTLKVMLVDKGFDIATIGFLSLVSLPYSLKIFYAPIVDSCGMPFLTKLLGQRRSWILSTQFLLMIFIAALGIAGIAGNLFFIALFATLVALASATQDIAVDAYRIELIEPENQGLAATFAIYGYRIGLLISGAFALLLSDNIGWDIVYFIMSACIFIGVAAILLAEDTRKNWRSKNYNFIEWTKNYVVEPIIDFIKKPRWYFILAFIICFKLGDVFAGSLTLPFLLTLDFTKTEIAAIVKTFGLFATLFGIFIGGVLVKKIGTYKSLWLAGIAQMLSNLTFSYLAQIGHSDTALYYTIFIENFSGGIGDSVFVAYLSILCNANFSATQYAALGSFASLTRSLFSSSAGVFAASLGWYKFFIFSTFLAIPGLIFLWILRKNK